MNYLKILMIMLASLLILPVYTFADIEHNPFELELEQQEIDIIPPAPQPPQITPREQCERIANNNILQPCLDQALEIENFCNDYPEGPIRQQCLEILFEPLIEICIFEYDLAMLVCKNLFPTPEEEAEEREEKSVLENLPIPVPDPNT